MIAALTVIGPQSVRGQAAIEGRVVLPKPEAPASAPPRYAGQVGEIAPPDPPVAVVYLEGSFPASAVKPTPGTNQLLQSGMQFRPAVLPIRVGTTVKFPNGDDFYHNVFSYSRSKRFDLGRYRKDDAPPVQFFDKPGVVKLYCEIHQHMRPADRGGKQPGDGQQKNRNAHGGQLREAEPSTFGQPASRAVLAALAEQQPEYHRCE